MEHGLMEVKEMSALKSAERIADLESWLNGAQRRIDELVQQLSNARVREKALTVKAGKIPSFEIPESYRKRGSRSAFSDAFEEGFRGYPFRNVYTAPHCIRAWCAGYQAGEQERKRMSAEIKLEQAPPEPSEREQALVRFFMEGMEAAFDGCDWSGADIQEKAVELGLARWEKYDPEKHESVGSFDGDSGDDICIIVQE